MLAAWIVGAVVGVAGLLILGSNILEKTVVYGRLARQLVPFLCLATGLLATRLLNERTLRLLWSTPHPLEYLPYQYEGSSPAARRLVRGADLSMRLVDRTAATD